MSTQSTFNRGIVRIVGLAMLVASLAATTLPGGTAEARRAVADVERVVSIADGTDHGYSVVRRNERGVRAFVRTTELERHHAYTVWAVVFNNPQACDGPCDAGDLGDPEVDAVSTLFAGKVVGGNRTNFAGSLRAGGDALRNPYGAEIHFIVRTHGPAIAGMVREQISTLNGGCPPNACANVQMSIHGR